MDGVKLEYYSCDAGSYIYQRFVLNTSGVFPYPFSLLLEKNHAVDDCVENAVLQAGLPNWEWLQSAQSTFSEAFGRNGIILSSFDGWISQAVTRFILVTQKKGAFPELCLDADPSSIQYPSSSLLPAFGIGPFKPIPTVFIDDIVVIKSLTAGRNIKLVEHDDSQYVLKTIDRQD